MKTVEMNREQFEKLCLEQYYVALDKILENAPEDYATMESDEFVGVAFRVFSLGLHQGYNLGTKQVVDQLKKAGVIEDQTIQ